MKKIQLLRGMVALVDSEDFERASQFKWHAKKSRNCFYAEREIRFPDGKRTTQYLHRLILPGVPEIDHRDGDGLNNQKYNLRPVNHEQQMRNQGKTTGRFSSNFKGVQWHKQAEKWVARISVGKRGSQANISLGLYEDEKDAAISYDYAAKIFFGDFARLNFP